MVKICALNVEKLNNPSLFHGFFELMPETRKKRILSLKSPKSKYLSLGAGILLYEELRKLGYSYKELTCVRSPKGKPSFPEIPDFHFNLSHSGSYAVLAVSDSKVGVDIEQIKAIRPSLLPSVLDETERSLYEKFDEEDKKTYFMLCWTNREAFLKYTGEGINCRPSEFYEKNRNNFPGTKFHTYAEIPDYLISLCTTEPMRPSLMIYSL